MIQCLFTESDGWPLGSLGDVLRACKPPVPSPLSIQLDKGSTKLVGRLFLPARHRRSARNVRMFALLKQPDAGGQDTKSPAAHERGDTQRKEQTQAQQGIETLLRLNGSHKWEE